METFSALLAICAGNSPVTGEFPTQRPVTLSFDVYFDLRPNERLSKQSWGWWFETLSSPLWRHRNDLSIPWPQWKGPRGIIHESPKMLQPFVETWSLRCQIIHSLMRPLDNRKSTNREGLRCTPVITGLLNIITMLCAIQQNTGVTSTPWPATRLISQQIVKVNIKINIKGSHYWPLRRIYWWPMDSPSQMPAMRKDFCAKMQLWVCHIQNDPVIAGSKPLQ